MILGILRKSELAKNTSILISGTIFAQIIPVLLQPVLRRYYSPAEYGAFAVYISMVGILVVVASFKYELATILPCKDKDAANILMGAFLINLLFNSLLLAVIIIWKSQISSFLNLPVSYSHYLYFVPLGTFLYNLYENINYWLVRKKSFFAIAKNKFIRRGSEGFAQVGTKWMGISNGLVFGDIVGQSANIVSGIYQLIRSGFQFRFLGVIKLKYVLKKYIEYPKFNVIPSMLSACSYLLPSILINKFYSSESTGFFDLSKLVLSIPLALVATAISSVLLQRISEKYKNKQSIVSDLFPILIVVISIIIVEVIVIQLFGKSMFEWVFGDNWGFSGQISKILVWSYGFNFIIATFSSLFISLKRIKLLSVWQLFYFIAIISLSYFRNYTFTDFIRAFVLIEITCYLSLSVLIIWIIKEYENKLQVRSN